MKFSIVALLSLASIANCQWYPNDRKGEIPTEFKGYEVGDEIYLECIQRQIDNGEHKFDENDRIIYSAFPKCKETDRGLALKYGVNEDLNCTIGFTDELYHLFQLYVHEDAPFSCRIPISGEPNSIGKGGAFVPLTFNFRGEVHDSHLDIDDNINVIAIGSTLSDKVTNKNNEGTVVSAVAWSSGTNATRIVIGDYLTLNLAVRWLGNLTPNSEKSELPYTDGFYKLPKSFASISTEWFYFYLIISAVIGAAIMYGFGFSSKMRNGKQQHKWADQEIGYSKND